MKSFFKTCGMGVLYLIGLPFILVFFILWSLYSLIIYIIQAIKSLILFFSGKNISDKTKEELAAEAKMKNLVFNPVTGRYEEPKEPEPQQPVPQQVVYQNINLNGNPFPPQNNQNPIQNPYISTPNDQIPYQQQVNQIPQNNTPEQLPNNDQVIDTVNEGDENL